MENIFQDNNIYPHDGKIKEHFKDFYDSVFIAYFPFFKVDNKLSESENYKKSKKITFEELKKEDKIFNNIPPPNAEIFSYSNEDYPTDIEIYNSGKIVEWQTIISQSGLKDTAELNKALRTSIGALKPIFRKPELAEKVNSFTSKDSIWNPTEGHFDIFSKLAIFKTFKLLGKNKIVIVDEFYENNKTINILDLTESEFAEEIDYNDYYIYSLDKEILFTLEWDSFFFLIATDSQKMEKILTKKYFEGFLCDSETTHNWDYLPGELQKLLEIELKQKTKAENKNWWKFWS